MKAQLLAARDLIVEELDWPDDFSDPDVMNTALIALGTYYDASGARITPRPHYSIIPYEVRVLARDGTETHRWTVVDLAKTLGKEPP
jgi:hypothetical protein